MSADLPADGSAVDWSARLAGTLPTVLSGIEQACAQAGRALTEVGLVAVSKHQPAAAVAAALRAGHCDFGENYAQELRDKAAELAQDPTLARECARLRWHFIGPLQRNKVNLIVGRVVLLHTVDSLGLIEAIAGRVDRLRQAATDAAQAQLAQDCLLQVNVGDEAQKAGCAPAELPRLLDAIAQQQGRLRCRGLMCIPPACSDPQAVRPYFALLRSLRDQHATGSRPFIDLRELSMGMSHDYEVAIAEGATLIRVGTALFGARSP